MATRLLILALVAAGSVVTARAQPLAAPLTLADALARARAAAPALAAARARRAAAAAARDGVSRLPNPVVELRSENWASGAPGGLPLDLFATMIQPLELGGKRAGRLAVAEAAMGTAAAAEGVAHRDLAAAVVADYLAAVRAGEQTAALGAHAERLAEVVRVLRRRVDVGSAPEGDLLKLRTEAARIALERTRADVAAARALAALGARLEMDVTLGQLRRPDPPPLPGEAVSGRHPDLVAAAGAVAAARAAARFERARAVPDLAVNAGVKRTAGYNTGLIALSLPIPLFDSNAVARAVAGGQLQAAEHEQRAAERRLRAMLAATRAAATALAAEASAVRRTLVDPARGARDAARAAFEAGALDVMRLVDAERVVIEAERVAVDLEVDALIAAIEARSAAGEDPTP